MSRSTNSILQMTKNAQILEFKVFSWWPLDGKCPKVSDSNHSRPFTKVFFFQICNSYDSTFNALLSLVTFVTNYSLLRKSSRFCKGQKLSICIFGFPTVLKTYLFFLLIYKWRQNEKKSQKMAVLEIVCPVNPLSVISFISVHISWNCTRWCSYWQNKQYVISSGIVRYSVKAAQTRLIFNEIFDKHLRLAPNDGVIFCFIKYI